MEKNTVFLKKGFFLLFFVLLQVGLFAQNITVTGNVTEQNGSPLPGVNILVLGTTQGTITDLDGNYSVNVAPDAQLEFKFIGYTTQTIAVNNQALINVVLAEDAQNIDEVVVVGYGTMKRTDLTGSLVSVSDEAISQTVSTSLDQALQGRAAGVQVMANSGTPGGSSSVRIRGISSLNGSNEPIYVIDGVIIDGSTGSGNTNALSSINPADIASVDILKDASATAIYGSRAANGVILITTKKGADGKATITYDGYAGWQEMPKKLELLNLQEYALHRNKQADLGIVMPDNNFVRADLLGEGTDWQEELFTKAMMTSHNVSVSGGNEKTAYSLGAGYLNQDGIAIGSSFERINLRGSFDSKLNNFLKTGVSFAFHNSKQKTTVSDESLIKIALKQTPNVAVTDAEGSYDGPDTDQYVQSNPVGLAMLKENRNEGTGIRANTFLEATIIEGLTVKTDVSLNYNVDNTYRFTPSYTFGALENTQRTGERSKSYGKFLSIRNIVNYNKLLFDVHNINVMLGQEAQKSEWEWLQGYRAGYLSNGATNLDAGDGQTATNRGNSGASSLSSFFGRVFYSFDDKYLLTATLRRDGSSKFAEGKRWGWFPSVALAWKVSNESFMSGFSFIDNLKLRLGWGKVGNQNIPNDLTFQTYRTVPTPTMGPGVLAYNTPNAELLWETTSSSNLGLDINLFGNRVEFIGDIYYKKTDNLLLEVPLPGYVGTADNRPGSTNKPWRNIGSLENQGIELTLNTVNMNKGDFMWRSSFVFSMNRNKVLSMDTETSVIDKELQEGSDVAIVTRTAVGKPIGQFYGYKVIGRFEKATDFYYRNAAGEIVPTALPADMEIGENGAWIGDYIFEDVNKDGVIDEGDLTYIGDPEPVSTFGLGNTFSYKGFELNIYLTGSYGNEVVNYQRRWLENPRAGTNLLSKALGYADLALIDPDGPTDYRNVHIVGGDADMPRIAASPQASESNFRFSDKFVEDGSYIRIQTVSLAYYLPKKWISRIGLSNVKVYSNIQNLYTFTKYSGYDPAIGSLNQDALMTGIDNARYPTPRIYTFGLNVTL